MATDKDKLKNTDSDKKMGTQKESTETSSLKNESTGTGNAGSEEKLSRSKAELDQKNREFESDRETRRTGPSTGGYGDQHDPQRYREPQNYQFDKDRDRSGTWDQNRYNDYDRGFRDGAEHASRHYNQENWSREKRGNWGQSGDMGYENEPRSGNYAGNPRRQNDWGSDRSYPYDNYGDADYGSSRSYPSMQSGYGDRNPENQRNENRDRGAERPYGEESYRRGERGEDRSYKGNEYGSPYEKERYEPGNRNRNEDQDKNANRGSNRYDRERHLRNEPMERERGDRDREW